MLQRLDTEKIARLGMLVALAFVFSYLESLLPVNIGIPGVKLGLSNLVVLFCLYRFSVRTAFGMAVVRIVLVGLTFGNLSTMLYSLAGGILSFFVMVLLKRSERFSVQGVSVAGGVAHNIGQICVAVLILQSRLLLYYLPFLMMAGVIAGVLIGLLGGIVIKRVP